ncbi:MAG TPA: Ppx/GppA phosphatase family protein [Solirubrobacteraceae bacterium]|nr:Ppx/GppA phosphatase family protein [Solirubrobacteraceae bacterium]
MADEHATAVVDLGSNSFRMVVYAWGHGRWRRTDEIFEAVRIGAGLTGDGSLSQEAIGRALATVDVFAHFARAAGIPPQEQAYVATSAVRDATNRDEFVARASEIAGTTVRVLSGEEEARYGYLAAVNSTTLADGAVLDLGGGSLQLVRVAGRREREASSWPLGAVRMTERFTADGEPVAPKRLERLRAHVLEELRAASWLPETRRLVGVGGTVRTLAAAIQRATPDVPAFGVQGAEIGAGALDELIERLAALPARERASVPGIKVARADLILAGAVVVRAAMEACRVGGLEVTEAGLREGILLERMLGRDVLVEDVRRASVLNLAARYLVETDHTRHVAELALGLFDELAAAGLHDGDPHERELLWAAAVLHDIGMAVDYDDHHKHTRYLILNAGLPGFTPREVALIAQTTRYHRKGMPALGELAPLMEQDDQALLDRCALLLRLAEDLERPRDRTVREAHARVQDGVVRLELVADGEARVSRWAASREVALFERAFGRRLEV